MDYEFIEDPNYPDKPDSYHRKYDVPFKLLGIPGNQICVALYDDGSHIFSTFSGPNMSRFSYFKTSWTNEDFFDKCEYCDATGMHHHEDDYYWMCRNCEGSGWVQHTPAPGWSDI